MSTDAIIEIKGRSIGKAQCKRIATKDLRLCQDDQSNMICTNITNLMFTTKKPFRQRTEGKLGETTFGAFCWLTSIHTLNRCQYLTHHPKRDVVRWQRPDQIAKIKSVDELRETENHLNEKAQAGTRRQGTPGLAKTIDQP